MSLVDVVVWILAQNYGFDGVEGCVTGPAVDVCGRWEDLFACCDFGGEELLKGEEVWSEDFVFEDGQPGGVEGVDFEGEQFFLLC